MAEQWPASLQDRLNQSGFNISPGSVAIRSKMGVGPAKVRQQYSKSIDGITSTINLDRSLYADLYTFFYTTLAGGVKAFEFNHPITDVLTEFRFTKPFSVSIIGGNEFSVSMAWEALP